MEVKDTWEELNKGGRFKFTAEVSLPGREGGRGNAVEIRGVQLERMRSNILSFSKQR